MNNEPLMEWKRRSSILKLQRPNVPALAWGPLVGIGRFPVPWAAERVRGRRKEKEKQLASEASALTLAAPAWAVLPLPPPHHPLPLPLMRPLGRMLQPCLCQGMGVPAATLQHSSLPFSAYSLSEELLLLVLLLLVLLLLLLLLLLAAVAIARVWMPRQMMLLRGVAVAAAPSSSTQVPSLHF